MEESNTLESGNMSKGFGPLLFKEKQVKILLAMLGNQQNWYISNLAKLANATYVHTSRFLNECEKVGLVVSEKHAKIKSIRLTEKGIQVANSVADIMKKIAYEQKEPQQAQAPKQPQ